MNVQQAIDYALDQLDKKSDPRMFYHNPAHTRGVMRDAVELARQCGAENYLDFIRVAAAYHDLGFIKTNVDHERASCDLAAETLPRFGFDFKMIDRIQAMIMATKLPQSPVNLEQMVVCDADLAYLGGNQYTEIANQLYREQIALGKFNENTDWKQIQVNFLESHHFHTEYAKKMFGPGKNRNLEALRNTIS
ncbi:MAG: HD domain-containing protein [Bacteroidetes bacterium]|nr:HD domain-containing protein [Bacteroidota bacterium]